MWNGMKSVVYFHPLETQEQRLDKFDNWMRDTGRKNPVPTPKQTREYLRKRGYYGASKI